MIDEMLGRFRLIGDFVKNELILAELLDIAICFRTADFGGKDASEVVRGKYCSLCVAHQDARVMG